MAYWKERTITGDVGLEVLSKGKFNFNTNSFEGTWLASSMISGPYLSFTALQQQQQQQQQQQSQSQTPMMPTATVVDATTKPYNPYEHNNNNKTNTPVIMGRPI